MGGIVRVFDLFSKRQADAAKSGVADVYQYDKIPKNLRVQVKQIAIEAVGEVGSQGDGITTDDEENNVWFEIERIYLREKGLEAIARADFAGTRVLSFMRECPTADWLDLLELIALGIEIMAGNEYLYEHQTWRVGCVPLSGVAGGGPCSFRRQFEPIMRQAQLTA
jgi:hypothetical protein